MSGRTQAVNCYESWFLYRKVLHTITIYSTALPWHRIVVCPVVAPGSLISVPVSSVSLLDILEGSLKASWVGYPSLVMLFFRRKVRWEALWLFSLDWRKGFNLHCFATIVCDLKYSENSFCFCRSAASQRVRAAGVPCWHNTEGWQSGDKWWQSPLHYCC